MMSERAVAELSEGDFGRREAQVSHDDAPVFRAVSTPTQRRGIRLEVIYWNALRMLAVARGATIGEIVGNVADGAPPKANLASLLRVRVLRWLIDRVGVLEAMTRAEAANAIIQASPSPAFALTADKRILFYNSAFLNLIQSHFVSVRPHMMSAGLRLSMDMQIEEVIRRLSSDETMTLSSGYVLGVEGQRLRGTVNMVLAPVHDESMVIAFVLRA